MLTDYIKNRVISKLGGPAIAIEIEDEQMHNLYENAKLEWELYSDLSDLSDEKKEAIKYTWTDSYFQALCKETLGRIRGKYNGNFSIPGLDISLEYNSLLKESEQEKSNLISLLIPSEHKITLAVYINVEGLDHQEFHERTQQISKMLSSYKSYNFFIIPVMEQESKIECIYPNFLYDEDMKLKLNVALDKLIENIKSNEQ